MHLFIVGTLANAFHLVLYMQALKRNAPGDASTAKVNSRKQRGRETSPSTVADAVYPSLPVTQPLSSSVAPLTDAADLAHSPDDQATAVKPALESEALPAITAVTGAHSQPDRATASEPKPAGVPVTTASKRRNARAAAKNLNSNAATLAGSKRRNPTVEQQHSSKVAADGAARTIKQHTDQVDDSTTVQTAVVSPHAESVPNGAAKKCAHLKEEPHAAPVEQSGKPQLLPPPTDAPPVCEAEARQDATGKQPSGAVSAAPTESRASEPTQPPIKAEPIEATSKKPHRRMRAAAAGAASSQMVAPTGTYAQTNRGWLILF